MRSSSISARSSISVACGRSTTCTCIPLGAAPGVDGVAGYNTALDRRSRSRLTEVREERLAAGHGRVGERQPARAQDHRRKGRVSWSGKWVQVSRLGNPLINEVVIPRHLKDYWNGQAPSNDKQFAKYYEAPELAGLVNFLYPALETRTRPVAPTSR